MAVFHREPIGPLDYSRRLWIRMSLLATFVFLYAPIVTLMAFSFNDSRRNIVWRGFTWKYNEKATLALVQSKMGDIHLNFGQFDMLMGIKRLYAIWV